ncbi:MAG TPA: hypothetical protein VI357_26475 [Mycobacteriales bacterium]
MVALLDPEWNLDGAATAQDLQRSVRASPTAPLPEPIRRAINGEPVEESEWPYDKASFNMVPLPGCPFTIGAGDGSREEARLIPPPAAGV